MSNDIVFIRKEEMTSVYNDLTLVENPGKMYEHFMNAKDDILYFVDGEKLVGVVSIGDLERCYQKKARKTIINRNFSFVEDMNKEKALTFFVRKKTVYEIPVVTEGRFLGVLKKEKEEELSKTQRYALENTRYGMTEWKQKELERFCNGTKAKVFVYTVDHRTIERSLKEKNKEVSRLKREGEVSFLEEKEWKKFWGKEYYRGIGEEWFQCLKELSLQIKNGIGSFENRKNKFFTFEEGCRQTPGSEKGERRIYMFGPCIVGGAYCKDNQTIGAYIQKKLKSNNYSLWEVINKGQCGPDYCWHTPFVEKLSENDIVIIFIYKDYISERLKRGFDHRWDLTEAYLEIPSVENYLVDAAWHCNYIVNEKLAEWIYRDLKEAKVLDTQEKEDVPKALQDYYISWDVHRYFTEYFEQYDLHKEDGIKAGAIVMNCNPFTKGHRYLIEKALEKVDKLYVFVVEEDASDYTFQDRMKMVELGVSDLPQVKVVPSGKYILSKETFAQYFEKDQVQIVENMDYDIYVFGEEVAKRLGISCRFVGEEPFDKVTREYNETMKRMLPDLGVEVIEIPRLLFGEEQQPVSATLVRKAVREEKYEELQKLCPESTVKYIMDIAKHNEER